MRFSTAILTLLLLSMTAMANESKVTFPDDIEAQVKFFYQNSPSDSSFTLEDIVNNNPELYPKVEEAHILTDKILKLYNYKGYFRGLRNGINSADPIDAVKSSYQKSYLQCLQDNLTADNYAKHLLTYSKLYVNSINETEYLNSLLIVDDIRLKELFKVYGKTWEDIHKPNNENAINLDRILINKIFEQPQTIELFSELDENLELSVLLNIPMMLDYREGLLNSFNDGVTAQCTTAFNNEFYQLINSRRRVRPAHH